MTINFESDKEVIVYALEKIISHARDHQYIFLEHSVWWISSILGLQEGLVIHIYNLKARSEFIQIKGPNNKISNADTSVHLDRFSRIIKPDSDDNNSESK
jgi:hypothetical protein